MKNFKGEFLVATCTTDSNMKYKVIHTIKDYEDDCQCIIVKSLNPDYYLLFSSIALIITEKGGPLSHLAIVAREHNLPLILVANIISEIPEKGRLSIEGECIKIETN